MYEKGQKQEAQELPALSSQMGGAFQGDLF